MHGDSLELALREAAMSSGQDLALRVAVLCSRDVFIRPYDLALRVAVFAWPPKFV